MRRDIAHKREPSHPPVLQNPTLDTTPVCARNTSVYYTGQPLAHAKKKNTEEHALKHRKTAKDAKNAPTHLA